MEETPGEAEGTDETMAAAVAAIAVLADPTRRALYRYVAARGDPVGREEAAAALGMAHHLARFHLDRLHEAGLVDVEYKRPAGRSGPGAGHPTKLYRPTSVDHMVSVPGRRYDLAGVILTEAVAAASRDDQPIGEALKAAATRAGCAIGAKARPEGARLGRQRSALSAALHALDVNGFVTRRDDNGVHVLGNCPFRTLAHIAPDVICGMNLALVTAVLDEAGVRTVAARLAPAEGRCCVTIG